MLAIFNATLCSQADLERTYLAWKYVAESLIESIFSSPQIKFPLWNTNARSNLKKDSCSCLCSWPLLIQLPGKLYIWERPGIPPKPLSGNQGRQGRLETSGCNFRGAEVWSHTNSSLNSPPDCENTESERDGEKECEEKRCTSELVSIALSSWCLGVYEPSAALGL